jgi:hypothetical protein
MHVLSHPRNLVVSLERSLLEIHYPNGEEADPDGPPYAAINRTGLVRHAEPLMPVVWLVRIGDEAQLRRVAVYNSAPVTEVPDGGPGCPA